MKSLYDGLKMKNEFLPSRIKEGAVPFFIDKKIPSKVYCIREIAVRLASKIPIYSQKAVYKKLIICCLYTASIKYNIEFDADCNYHVIKNTYSKESVFLYRPHYRFHT